MYFVRPAVSRKHAQVKLNGQLIWSALANGGSFPDTEDVMRVVLFVTKCVKSLSRPLRICLQSRGERRACRGSHEGGGMVRPGIEGRPARESIISSPITCASRHMMRAAETQWEVVFRIIWSTCAFVVVFGMLP